MPEPTRDIHSAPQPQLQPMQVVVHGRVNNLRRFSDGSYIRLTTPAEDEYSMPQHVEVKSSEHVGSVGDNVKLLCKLRGVPRAFDSKQTGERIHTANMFLELVRRL